MGIFLHKRIRYTAYPIILLIFSLILLLSPDSKSRSLPPLESTSTSPSSHNGRSAQLLGGRHQRFFDKFSPGLNWTYDRHRDDEGKEAMAIAVQAETDAKLAQYFPPDHNWHMYGREDYKHHSRSN
jgi:hypothetical protein